MIAGKTLSDYNNLFSKESDYQKKVNIIYKYLKEKYGEKNASLDFSLKKIDETRNYLLEEIKHND